MLIFVIAVLVLIFLLFLLLQLVGFGLGILLFLVVAALCAALAEYVLGMREGVGTTLIIGVIGSAIGLLLQHLLNLPTIWAPFHVPVLWTIVGSLLVVLVVRLATGGRRHPHWV